MGRPPTGKIVARGKDTWRIYWELGPDPETGKRRQRTETFHGTKDEARKHQTKIQARINAGDVRPHPQGVTVKDLVGRWLTEYLPTQNLRPSSVQHYHDYSARYLVPQLGDRLVARLTPLDVQRALAAWLQQPRRQGGTGTLSPTTVRKIYRLLRQILDQAVEWDLLDANPARKVKPPAPDDYHPQVWDAPAIRRFLMAAVQHRWGVGFRLGLLAGLRRGEILGLQWRDIDWETGTLTIRHTRVHIRGHDIDEVPKTRSGWRTVVLDAETVRWLHWRRAYMESEIRAAGDAYRDQGYVLQTGNGTPVMTRNFNRAFDHLCEEVGVAKIRLHDLRHTQGTGLHEAGVDLRTIQDRLGHSSIAVTSRFYVHPSVHPQRAAVDRLVEWIGQEDGPKNGPK